MSETAIQRRIQLAIGSQPGVRCFRNQVGAGVAGRIIARPEPTLLLVRGSQVTMGLCTGSSDLIGWRTVGITPDMVGRRIAQFMAVEVKTPTGRLSDDQIKFIAAVTKAGGLAGVARSSDDAMRIIRGEDVQ